MFLLPFLIALEASPAGAATVEFSVYGLERVRAVVLVVDDGSGAQVVPCRDDGEQFDLEIDGIWTCEPFTSMGTAIWTVLLTDGEAVRLAAVPVISPRLEVGLKKTIGGVIIETGTQEIAPVSDAQATPPGLILLTRLRTVSTQGAPMLQVQTEDVVVEHPCRDDGGMFDEELNDGIFLCAGFLPGPDGPEGFNTTISLRRANGESEEPITLGLTGGSGIRFAEIDASGQSPPQTEGFSLRVLPISGSAAAPAAAAADAQWSDEVAAAAGAAQRRDEVAAAAGAAQWSDEVTAAAGAAQRRDETRAGAGFKEGDAAAAQAKSESSLPRVGMLSQPAVPGGPWRLVSLMLVLGIGLVWLRGRVQHRVPVGLEPVGPPSLGRIGPRPGGEPVGLVVSDIPSALTHLVSHLSGHRRVVLLGLNEVPAGLPVGHPVYTLRSAAMADALDAIRGLIRSPGAPVGVIIARPTLLDPDASVSPVALTEFYEALDALVWSVTLQGPEDETRPDAQRWVLEADGSWSKG